MDGLQKTANQKLQERTSQHAFVFVFCYYFYWRRAKSLNFQELPEKKKGEKGTRIEMECEEAYRAEYDIREACRPCNGHMPCEDSVRITPTNRPTSMLQLCEPA